MLKFTPFLASEHPYGKGFPQNHSSRDRRDAKTKLCSGLGFKVGMPGEKSTGVDL